MFTDKSILLKDNPIQMNYGIAVADIDNDGAFEIFVASFGGPNLVLKWNGHNFINIADTKLADIGKQAIGVAAGDIDGDGIEEIYVLNTDTFTGKKRFGDRLFDYHHGEWIDLFSLPEHQKAINLNSGRSVVCIDRKGSGLYGFFIANYGSPMCLYELNKFGHLKDVAAEAGLNLITGGRGIISLPIVSPYMDIFAANENGTNFLFRNRGDGTFTEIAEQCGILDQHHHGRGIAVLDANGNGLFDIVYGNWQGPHRLYLQTKPGYFQESAPPLMSVPTRIRNVIAADFDNDGFAEIFFNNIGEPNRLFGWRDNKWEKLDTGDAWEPDGLGTGAAVGDFDGDGQLELIIAHGESFAQPLSLYHPPKNDNNWLRVLPLTRYGSPARGAVCKIIAGDRLQIRAIDAGSGYLCQMEPIAHFGLGSYPQVEQLEIIWPDGVKIKMEKPTINQLMRVPYPTKSSN